MRTAYQVKYPHEYWPACICPDCEKTRKERGLRPRQTDLFDNPKGGADDTPTIQTGRKG